ncbi:MAG: glycoside hydrolase family 65 protein [Clostridia bacterium]|nr:glycoside hydrolase family 65 protein [Clostridia bacterium]
MYGLDKNKNFSENNYDIADEPVLATLFTTGNGYMGVRGSFEEFGSQRVQGAFVRGFIDEIIEVTEPFTDNEYMKKYYLDEEKLKTFEKQDSCVNMHDFLTVKITVGNKTFFPWEGRILRWHRFLDPKTAIYTREVVWDDGLGNRTELIFERFASFSDEHLYCQKIKIRPINHDLPVKIMSGIDTYIKTGGQFITKTDLLNIEGNDIIHRYHATNKYGFSACYGIKNLFPKGRILGKYDENGTVGIEYLCDSAKAYTFEKLSYIITDRDTDKDITECASERIASCDLTFDRQKKAHISVYKSYFATMDVKIEGDDEIDAYLRFASYHTAISASMKDSIHGISAKGLTGERYNQFVWWDCEIHQMPFFLLTAPQTAKNALMYRYRMLEQAKKNAKEKGYDGAMFAFCSSVNGDERVWQYARHPFMQIHINSDIPYGIINYYRYTGDREFMLDCGMEMILECLKFWISRVTLNGDRYEIREVTGTDEHHPYVDNDAYTNYCVKFAFDRFISLCEELNYKVDSSIVDRMKDISSRLYLPVCENGLIPQFDGYFGLSRSLEEQGKGTLKQFQMKKSGLYHKSQIIKQPDVVLLYTMVDVGVDRRYFAQNWDYYENMCEVSSSLTFPVHAIAAAQNNQILSFRKNLLNTVKMDVDDIHGVAWQGVHSGCLAGGYLAVIYGIFGLSVKENDTICLNPVRTLFDGVTAHFLYKGTKITMRIKNNKLTVSKRGSRKISVEILDGERKMLKNTLEFDVR